MNTITEFLSYLSSLDIKLWAEGDRLRCNAPKDTLTAEIKAELAARKAEILAFFSQENLAIRENSKRIQPMSRPEKIPLSFAQQRLWFFTQLEPESFAYHLPIAVKLKGQLNIKVISQSLTEIVHRHEGLRTNFTVVNEEPVQVIGNADQFALSVIDLQDIAEAEQQQTVLKWAASDAQKPFNLTQDSLIRATLLQLSETNFVLLLTLHHIISDGWSLEIFIKELTSLYGAFLENKPSPLSPLPIQYADFAIWQRQWLQGEVLQTQLNYWKQQLKGDLPILELPCDGLCPAGGYRPRPTIQSNHGAAKTFILSSDITQQLKVFSQQQNVTLFMTLLAAFKVLLYRYTQQQDLLIGTPIANRNRSEIEGLIGFFVNTLVLRTNLGNNPSFKELLQQVREVTLEAYSHQDLPFERLVEELQPGRNLSYNPLFQVMFILQNAPTEQLKLPDLTLETLTTEKNTANFDLTLSISETQTGLIAEFEYNTDLFNSDRISRMGEHFQVLLEGILANPEQRLSDLPLLTAKEKNQLFFEWNGTQLNVPQNLCIHQLFEAQVEKTPDAVAVVFEQEYLTYQQLNQKANQFAHYLQEIGIKPEALIGISVERSLEMMVGILGILKAGAAYVPLDPNYPKDRLAYMVEDSQIQVLITQERLLHKLPNHIKKLICLDANQGEIDKHKTTNLNTETNPNYLAYVIYTSGSTGQSKGVMIEHLSLVNAYFSWEDAYQLRSRTTSHLQMASFSFDVFSGDWIRALCSGSKLVLCPRDFLLEPDKLYQLMVQETVDCAEFVPVVLRNLIQYLETNQHRLDFMRLLVCGSDSWYVREYQKIRQFCSSQTRLINSFGVTEATIDSSYFETENTDLSPDQLVPIGRPFANTKIYILDPNLNPLPIGIPGELYISGIGVARGYLNRPDLTKERFISVQNFPSTKLYKTGDLARYLPTGEIEYLGRIDHQVKIRGFRIEIGEIETQLIQHPEVKEAVVSFQEYQLGEKRLVAYIILKKFELNSEKFTSELRQFLRQKLPEYMIPSAFISLDTFPLTPNGKIDRRALPTPDWLHRNISQNLTHPRTAIEEAIAQIWTQILGLETVGIDQNFFELGGHSLLATQLISRLRQIFQIELPLQKIFEFPTVSGLANVVGTSKKIQDSFSGFPIFPMSRKEPLPLSFAQQRLWFLEQLQPNKAAYNITEAVRVLGSLNITALEASLNEIIKRHEALRTFFIEVEGSPLQIITEHLQLSIPILDLQPLSTPEKEHQVQQIITQEIQQPFNLQELPLLRVILIKLTATESVIVFTMHHIISDAWSMAVLIQEFVALYPALAIGNAIQLPQLPIQYGDFAVWQRQWLQGEVLQTQLTYWKQKLGAKLPVLKLPYLTNQALSQRDQAGIKTFTLSAELSQALNSLSLQENVTLFMTLMAALNTLFYRATGQDDIVIGTDVANRNRGETEKLIGFFVNLLILRTDLSGYPSFRELLQRVRTVTLEAYSHQDLPFEKLVEELQPERHFNHSPLFQVLFVMDNVPTQTLELPGLQLMPIEANSQTAKFDLTLFMSETPSGIRGTWSYKSSLFEPEKLTLILESFVPLLQSIVTKPDSRINTLDLLKPLQKQGQQEQSKLKKLMQIKPKTLKL